MNAKDKKTIKEVYVLVNEMTPITNAMKEIANERVKLFNLLKQIEPFVEPLEDIYGREQEKFDNRSERWQESEAGQNARELNDWLESIHSNLQDCLYYLKEMQ